MSVAPTENPLACQLCRQLPDYQKAYYDRDEKLEPAFWELEKLGRVIHRCPHCGCLYAYDYWPPGPGNIGDFATATRFPAPMQLVISSLLQAEHDATGLAGWLAAAGTLTDSQDWDLVGAALDWLAAKVGDEEVLKAVSPLLQRPQIPARRFALIRLRDSARAGKDFSTAFGGLQQGLRDELPDLRNLAAQTLAFCLAARADWLPLRQLLGTGDGAVCVGAATGLRTAALHRIDLSPLLGDLARLLGHADTKYQEALLSVLDEISSQRTDVRSATSELVQLLARPVQSMRDTLARILGRVADTSGDITPAIPHLLPLLDDRSYDTRLEAVRALGSAIKTGADLGPAIGPLIRVLQLDPLSSSTLNGAVLWALKEFARTTKPRTKAVLKALEAAGFDPKLKAVAALKADLSARRSPAAEKPVASKPTAPKTTRKPATHKQRQRLPKPK